MRKVHGLLSGALVAIMFVAINLLTAPLALGTGVAVASKVGEGPVRFGRNANGGPCLEAQNCICIVTSLVDSPEQKVPGTFRSCAQDRQPRWVVFEARGTIRLQRPINVRSDKLIDGRPI